MGGSRCDQHPGALASADAHRNRALRTAFGLSRDPATIAYVLTLDLLQVGAGLLTLGLVRAWGERWPSWIPGLGGRPIPPRLVMVVASVGDALVLAITATLLIMFGLRLVGLVEGTTPLEGTTGWGFWLWLAMYLPWLAWGPALTVAIVGFWRRHRSPASRPTSSPASSAGNR